MMVTIGKRHQTTEKTQPDDLRVREIQYWHILDPDDTIRLRYDFHYRDPCNGSGWMQVTDVVARKGEPETADFYERVIAPCKALIARNLRKKCGLDYAVANAQPMNMYIPGMKVRMV